MPRRTLVVVKEPEIHKNPLKVMEYVERLIKKVEEKDVTVDSGQRIRNDKAVLSPFQQLSRQIVAAGNILTSSTLVQRSRVK